MRLNAAAEIRTTLRESTLVHFCRRSGESSRNARRGNRVVFRLTFPTREFSSLPSPPPLPPPLSLSLSLSLSQRRASSSRSYFVRATDYRPSYFDDFRLSILFKARRCRRSLRPTH